MSEREVLEFEGDIIGCFDSQISLELMENVSKIDLTNYDIKVIATPKGSPYEGKSREELIEIINELKAN